MKSPALPACGLKTYEHGTDLGPRRIAILTQQPVQELQASMLRSWTGLPVLSADFHQPKSPGTVGASRTPGICGCPGRRSVCAVRCASEFERVGTVIAAVGGRQSGQQAKTGSARGLSVFAFMSEPAGLDRAQVAALMHREVAALSHEELLQVIAAARLPFVARHSLHFQERGTLERLAHLSRRAYRHCLRANPPSDTAGTSQGVAGVSQTATGPA